MNEKTKTGLEILEAALLLGILGDAGVNADVAVRRVQKIFQISKRQTFVRRECADNSQTHSFVNNLVEFS